MTQRWLGQLVPGNCASQVGAAEVASPWGPAIAVAE